MIGFEFVMVLIFNRLESGWWVKFAIKWYSGQWSCLKSNSHKIYSRQADSNFILLLLISYADDEI